MREPISFTGRIESKRFVNQRRSIMWRWKYHALQRKSHLCILRKGIARPQSQFPHSSICERFILPRSVHKTPHIFLHVFLFLELRGLSPSFHIHESVSELYIPRIGPPISCRKIARSILGIYINRSKTHECGNWDCGHAIPFLGIFVSNFLYCVFAVVAKKSSVSSRWSLHCKWRAGENPI